jgi:hypothetical protein
MLFIPGQCGTTYRIGVGSKRFFDGGEALVDHAFIELRRGRGSREQMFDGTRLP